MAEGFVSALRALLETRPPDGWFVGDLLWFDSALTPATILARGAVLELPDLKNADEGTHEACYEALGGFLCQLADDEVVQFQWSIDANYHAELEAYRDATQRLGAKGWCALAREERYLRYHERQSAGKLRREKLEVYLSRRCSSVPKGGFRTAALADAYLEQTGRGFAEKLSQLEGRLPGARVRLHDDAGHFRSWRAFCQPGLRLLSGDPRAGFDPGGSILENCWPGGGITTRDPEGNVYFRMDGQYHALVVLRRWPMETQFGIIWSLTGALPGNACYTLSCRPLDAAREVLRTEEEMRRLRGSRSVEGKDSLDDVLARKKARISALQGGFARPFSVLPVIRVWDCTLQGLSARVQALKEAVLSMGGAQCHQVDDEVQAKCLFYESLPGWAGGRYRDWDLFALGGRDPAVCFLQDLVPLSSSYTGHLDEAEAIYDGAHGNLAGLRSFAGATPQHAVMVGTTRSGKSSQVIDYLSQSDCFFAFRGIIEEGLSYGTLVRLLGGESLILHPDADIVINYLDTQGLPLTRLHVAAAAGLQLVMCGRSRDPESNQHRKAMLSEYIEQLYADTWNDVRSRRPGLEFEAARWAILAQRLLVARAGKASQASLPEILAELRERQAAGDGWVEGQLSLVGEAEAIAAARRTETASWVRDVGFSFLDRGDFPTHTSMVEALRYNRLPHHTREQVERLASLLSPWQRGGPHGRLFDGSSNRSLENRLIHFELGLLPSANAEMKEAAVFLLANRLRQRIITLPRALRKQFLFEEPSRYLQVGGMEELLGEFYAQMGKYGCHILPVTQQYGQLSSSALRPVIFGNSKQFLLFRQNDRRDLEDLSKAVGLPAAASSAISRFTAPEYQAGGEAFSEMAVFSVEGERSACGIVRNHASREMLYVSESSGALFDERNRLIAAHEDPVAGVLAECAAPASRPRRTTP